MDVVTHPWPQFLPVPTNLDHNLLTGIVPYKPSPQSFKKENVMTWLSSELFSQSEVINFSCLKSFLLQQDLIQYIPMSCT